jgi:hypothetical protein
MCCLAHSFSGIISAGYDPIGWILDHTSRETAYHTQDVKIRVISLLRSLNGGVGGLGGPDLVDSSDLESSVKLKA